MPFRKGHRSGGRKSTRLSLSVTPRTSTPRRNADISDDDEEMLDADAEAEVDGDVPEATPDDDEDAEGEEEDAATPAQDEDGEDDAQTPPTITTIPRRRGRGGGRAARTRVDYQNTPEPGADEGSESGTPVRRRRGRPPGSTTGRGRGGFRGRRKGQQPEAPRVVIDKDGTTLDVVDDEAQVDEDGEGEGKVDSMGNLQGGREYRVRTFTIIGRGDRLYMLSTEPARCCGFRDSYLFFTKHPKLYKVLIGEEEKKDLIERDILPNSYKGRNIGVVTARSVFREFGARIVVGGRKITDDYRVAEARANGDVEGELADPEDYLPDKKEDYNRNRYVAWFGASEVYRSLNQSGPAPTGKPNVLGKRRNNITLENWQTMHAQEASRFNTTLTALRHANLNGVYEQNTNMIFYPKTMQPTHAQWEYIPPGTVPSSPPTSSSTPTLFPPVPSIISRTFAVIDTLFVSPPISNPTGYPGPDGHTTDPAAGPNGLTEIPDALLDELDPQCRAALEDARRVERQWKMRWDGGERHTGLRAPLKIGFNGYPV